MMRTLILGNAGSGKTTMARNLIGTSKTAFLSMDEIAWEKGTAKRKPLDQSVAELRGFAERHDSWVIEGCYADLAEALLPYSRELIFLNPGIDVCVENCRRRPWEPEKYPSYEAQQQMLEMLIEWVKLYETRRDEYGLQRHRRIFESFQGAKREIVSLEEF